MELAIAHAHTSINSPSILNLVSVESYYSRRVWFYGASYSARSCKYRSGHAIRAMCGYMKLVHAHARVSLPEKTWMCFAFLRVPSIDASTRNKKEVSTRLSIALDPRPGVIFLKFSTLHLLCQNEKDQKGGECRCRFWFLTWSIALVPRPDAIFLKFSPYIFTSQWKRPKRWWVYVKTWILDLICSLGSSIWFYIFYNLYVI